MILDEQLREVGKVGKPHGVKGELSCTFSNSAFDIEELEYIVLQIDGINVPFFIEEYRTKGADSLLLKLEGVDDEAKARTLTNLAIYIPKEALDDNEAFDIQHLVGFELIDTKQGAIGVIEGIDDSTANLLLEVGDLLIPISEELVENIDEKGKKLYMNLPNGLLDLYE